MAQEINYIPLDDMQNAWSVVFASLTEKRYIQGILLIIVGLLLTYFARHPMPIFGAAILISYYLNEKVRAFKNTVWQNFAQANGWRYAVTNPTEAIAEGIVPPSLLAKGTHSPEISPVVEAVVEGHTFNLYMYKFTTGSGKSSVDHFCTIADVRLAKPFPHLLLDSKANKFIRNKNDAKQRIKLEGNFDDYFELYIQAGQHINALSVITPDVMQTLIDTNASQDIEIHEKHLFFMFDSDQRNVSGVQTVFVAVDALADQIAHRARTIKL